MTEPMNVDPIPGFTIDVKLDGPTEMTAARMGAKSSPRRLNAPQQTDSVDFLGAEWEDFLSELSAAEGSDQNP